MSPKSPPKPPSQADTAHTPASTDRHTQDSGDNPPRADDNPPRAGDTTGRQARADESSSRDASERSRGSSRDASDKGTNGEEWRSAAPPEKGSTPPAELARFEKEYPAYFSQPQPFVPVPTAIRLEVAADLHPWVKGTDPLGRSFRDDLVDPMRVAFFEEWGVYLPPVTLAVQSKWQAGAYQIALHHTPVASGQVRRDHLLVAELPQRLELLGVNPESTQHPVWRREASWVHREHSHLFVDQPLQTWDCGELLTLVLHHALHQHVDELVGIQEVQCQLDLLADEWPALVEHTLAELPLPRLRQVLRQLARDHVSLYRLRSILELVLDASLHTQSTEAIVDAVRRGYRHHLCATHATQGQLVVYGLTPDLEQELAEKWRERTLDHVPPAQILERRQLWNDFLAAVDRHLSSIPVTSTVMPILLTQQHALRRPLQQLLRPRFPWLDVLAVDEISPLYALVPIGTLSLQDLTSQS